MFRGRTIHDYYQEVEADAKREIANQSDEDILGLDTTEYANYLFAKYALVPVERDGARDVQVELVRQTANSLDSFGFGPGEMVIARVQYPIIPHSTAQQVLSLLPSSQRSILPRFDLQHDCLVLHVRLPFLYYDADSPPTGSGEIDSALENLEWWLGSRKKDILHLNSDLRPAIEQMLRSRKDYVSRTRSDFEGLIKQVHFPLKLRPATQDTTVPLPIRRDLKPILVPPTPKRSEEYTLKKEEVLAVVELVKRFGRSLEATPRSVAGLGEEDIRALILAQLNGVVDGAATGEAFSKLGKTDIHLKLPKGDILIAECKVWRGAKAYSEAVDQTFGYLTWRQCYAIIIAFVRNTDFTNVLAQARSAIQGHRTFQDQFDEQGEAHFVSRHVFPDDPRRSVEFHHLFFHFPPVANEA